MGFFTFVGNVAADGYAWSRQRGRWKWLLALLGLAVGAFLIFQVHSSHKKTEALKTALSASQGEVSLYRDARAADEKAVVVVTEAKATIDKVETVGIKRTRAALIKHKAWADEPIPADVLASLSD